MPDSTTRFPARTETVPRRGLRACMDQIQLGLVNVDDALRRLYFRLADGAQKTGAAA